jgi:outer membrane protein OmpA-like peptidoglycan-associated protein
MRKSYMSAIKQIIFLSFLLIAVMIGCVYTYINTYEMTNNSIVEDTPVIDITTPKEDEKVAEEQAESKDTTTKIEENIKEEVAVVQEDTKPEILDEKVVQDEEKDKIILPKAVTPQEQKIEELSKKIQPKNNLDNNALDDKVINKTLNSKTQEEIDEILSKEKIFFKRLSTDITDKSYKVVEDIAKILEKNSSVRVEIGGHTDAKGEDEVNEWISLQRAKSVKNELVKLGISKDRIVAKGYGESKPLVPNDKNGYSFENRRVEFKIIEE